MEIAKLKSKKTISLISFLIIGIIFSFIYLKPFLGFGNTMLLRLDWHKEFQLTGATWISLVKYNEFPFWNPYKAGGNFLFAHPESNVLSPETLLVVLFGPIKGLYYSVFFFYVLGFIGCCLIGRHLKLSFIATLYLAIVFTFSSYVMNNLFMGASMWMAFGYVPFAFYFLLKADQDWKYGIIAGLFHALIYLAGAIYIYMLFILFAALFVASSMIAKRNFGYAKGLAALFLFSLLFASIKILPNLDLYAVNPRATAFQKIPFGFDLMKKAFLDKQQSWDIVSAYTYKGENFHFPSYGDYIGIIPIALGFIAVLLLIKNPKWALPFFGSLLIYLSNYTPFAFIWQIIHAVPPFNSLERPARFVIFFALMLALLGSLFISKIDNMRIKDNRLNFIKKIALIAIVLFIFIDLTKASYIITSNFKPWPMEQGLLKWEEPFEYHDFYDRFNITEQQTQVLFANYFKSWAHVDTLSNKGSVRFIYDPMPIPTDSAVVKSKADPGYRGEYYFEQDENSKLELIKRTTNKIMLKANSEKDDILIINQKYHKAWKSNGFEVINKNGLVGVRIPKGEHIVKVHVFQNKFLVGSFLTLIGIISGAYIYFKRKV